MRSGSLAVIVPQHSAQPLPTFDRPSDLAAAGFRVDDFVLDPLMVTLGVVVLEILADGIAERLVTEEDHPVQALVLECGMLMPFQN